MYSPNKIYGLFANGTISNRMLPYYRYSLTDRKRLPDINKKAIERLIPASSAESSRAQSAELLLQLMRTGEGWVAFKELHDPVNTYDVPCVEATLPVEPLFDYAKLLKWAESSIITSDNYPTQVSDTALERIVKALYAFVETSDNV